MDRLCEFRNDAAKIARQYDDIFIGQNVFDEMTSASYICDSIRTLAEYSSVSTPFLVLDLGGGAGHYANLLTSLFDEAHILVVDAVPEMLNEGRKRFGDNQRLEWLEDSLPELKKLPVEGIPYSFAYSLGCFHYLDSVQRQASLRRISEIMPSGAHMVISFPYPRSRSKGQYDVSRSNFEEDIDASREWSLWRFETLPYPVKSNVEADKDELLILVFDLVK